MRRAYQTILLLYPATYRAEYQSEMADVFEQALGDCGARGFFARLVFLWHELAGVLTTAFAMRTGEYLHRSRPFAPSLALGAAVAAFAQSVLFSNCGIGRHLSIRADIADTQPSPADLAIPLALIGACLMLIVILSATFVWNMRNIRKPRA